MPLATLLLPPVILAAAAVLGWGLELAGVRVCQPVAALASWLALAVLIAAWFTGGRTALELTTPVNLAGVSVVLRLDAVTVLFWLVVLTPAALLLTFQPHPGGRAALAALAVAVALATFAAGSLLLTAFGIAACASLVLVLMRQEAVKATTAYWMSVTGAWLVLTWTAVLLEVSSGTSAYSAIPVTALRLPLLGLLAVATLLCSGLLPWRTWVSDVWSRNRLEAGSLAVALLVPLGFAPLVRAYSLGVAQLSLVLSALGAVTAVGAAVRAQAAASRRDFLAEAVPLGAGMALLGLGLATPLGVVAALAALAGVGIAAGLAPLASDATGVLAAMSIGALTGVPPGLAFGGWLLTLQAALEAGSGAGFLGLAGAAAWLLALAAAARSTRLPAVSHAEPPPVTRLGTGLGLGLAAAGGAGLTALLALITIPAAAEVMPPAARSLQQLVSPAAILSPGSLAVSTASGAWAAALLGGPLVVLGGAGVALVHLLRRRAWLSAGVQSPVPETVEPLFSPPLAGFGGRALQLLRSFHAPEQYRSLLRPALVEQAITGGKPWFWIVATVALAIAVTR